MSCENCERDIERLRGELNVLRREMIEVVGGMLARVDEVLATVKSANRQMFAEVDEVLVTVKSDNRQMFADLQAQTDRGFASIQARIDALPLPLSERKNDEPPKLN
jgi:hypothetical protein